MTVAARNSGPCVLWNNLGNCGGGPAVRGMERLDDAHVGGFSDNHPGFVCYPPDGFILVADEGRGGGITDQRCSLLRGGNPPRMTDTIGALENSCGRRIDGDACEGRLLARAGQQRMGFPEGTQATRLDPGV